MSKSVRSVIIKTESDVSPPKRKARTTKKDVKKRSSSVESDTNDTGVKAGPSAENDVSKPPQETYQSTWSDERLLSELEDIDYNISRNIIKLFVDENTIPFIARYRKELTGSMSPEKLRSVKQSYEDIIKIKSKASSMVTTIKKQGKLTESLKRCILSAKSMNELEHIYAPFKVSKHSLAEKARSLGLESTAIQILEGKGVVDPARCVSEGKKGLSSVLDILLGIQHIIADIISKDRDLLDELQKIYKNDTMFIESSLAKQPKKDTKQSSSHAKNKSVKNVDQEKFKLYFDFKCRTSTIQPYQILAINRGESLKVLSVKIVIPDAAKYTIQRFCESKWLRKGIHYPTRDKLFKDSFQDAYKRLISPLITREIRNSLNKKAEDASIQVFSSNLKHLLMTQPVKGCKILGIDPGFSNGCKMALISELGKVLDTAVIYPHSGKTALAEATVANLMNKYNCSLIALGNGTACRETEQFLGKLINSGQLPRGTRYSIINERGASIYSCSDEAIKEFPKLDTNLRSAVYIARCLQDPLCEMVKIDPKHLGVGMYQHDVSQKLLASSLHEVVIECVSFVGVDINTVSHTLLKQVAGIGNSKAEKIIKFRDRNGPFRSRDGVRDVAGIGPKSYIQFIGFIRVVSDTSGCETNPLDRTWIHPESYHIAEIIAERAKLSLKDIGKQTFIENLKSYAKVFSASKLAAELVVPEAQVNWVIESLSRDPNKDYRCDSKSNEPLFRKNVTSLDDLKIGETLTGIVENVTDFGAFVDIGVGTGGLIHVSNLRKHPNPIELGYRVEVKIVNLEIERKRIGLDLLQVL